MGAFKEVGYQTDAFFRRQMARTERKSSETPPRSQEVCF